MMSLVVLLSGVCIVCLGLLIATCMRRIPLSRSVQNALCQIILVCVGVIAIAATSGL
ncbi:hypothetical protein [Pseudooctadecabacter jejudonensis]|uniref:Uncharacterized protein n=1 Tax=Pseudooctadecabacter jejudonensis TaxID=1391910 RepID=A0A1Y5RRC5_9RHOB|nr:hypothetical protein [Pseudooctadecabacter jejudonensis]SLN23430.1 hypothetical protein PSJ8397_00992 [Pseudooctadecabacter jejudonensis]